MLESLLHHKKEEKEYFLALAVTEDRLDVALWESTKDGKITVLKTAREAYEGEWENAIDAADRAVSSIESTLPSGAKLVKVVFGLFPEWLHEDHIKDTYLKQLKQLTTALSLTPIGFVEMPVAVAHLLQKEESAQQTVILVGLESKHVTLSIFKIGKLVRSITHVRTSQLAEDIEKILTEFADLEVLPSRMLLYGTSSDTESAKNELLNHPWQKKANFLHFPKIEVLADEFPVRAVAVASATEITPHVSENEEIAEVPPSQASETTVPETSAEVTSIAEDLGFVKGDGEVRTDNFTPETTVTPTDEMDKQAHELANVEPVVVPTKSTLPSGTTKPKVAIGSQIAALFSQIKKPQFTVTLKRPHFSKLTFLIGIVAFVLILGGVGYVAYWMLPHATINILVAQKPLDKTVALTFDESATQPDVVNNIIPAKMVSVDINGDKTVPTTGKKTIGDHAKGDVTIYNKTLNTKLFSAGTALSSGSLNFTLDSDTTVASASEGIGSLTYGTTKASITAADIGTASNLSPGSDFSFSDLPTTSYSARNDSALTGGTSQNVAVVSRDDQKAVHDQVLSDLDQKAQDSLKQKVADGEKFLENTLQNKVAKEVYSKEVGEQSDSINDSVTVTVSGLVYQNTDIYAYVDAVMTQNAPTNYSYKHQDVQFDIEGEPDSNGSKHSVTAHIQVKLSPKVETTSLAQKLAGRSLTEATTFLKDQAGISGVEYKVDGPFSFLRNKLPANANNIKIQIATL